MSIWTHVCGIIRIDSVPKMDKLWIKEIKEKLGGYNSPVKTPTGSEGDKIEYKIEIVGEKNSLNRGIIYIWGDLRDFDVTNFQEIRDWLDRIDELSNCWIRQGVVRIEDSNDNLVVLNWEGIWKIIYKDIYQTLREK